MQDTRELKSSRVFFCLYPLLLRWCVCALRRRIRRLVTHRVRGSLDEGLNLHNVGIGKLAGEIRHAPVHEWAPEDSVFQVGVVLGRRTPRTDLKIVGPIQAEVFDVVGVDLVEFAETGFSVIETNGGPVL